MDYKTTLEIEVRVARYMDICTNTIVPNISWGLGIHECDLMVVSSAGYVTEIEIKVSKSDLLAESKKKHSHDDPRIKNFYFAVPSDLADFALEHIPERAGLIIVSKDGQVRTMKSPVHNHKAEKLTPEEHLKVARLGSMRMWGLKEKIIKYKEGPK